MSKVIIYSDGGADPNPGIGGWAAVLRYGDQEKVLTGNSPSATNNQMELQAAIAALQALKRPSSVEFHTDSEYLRKGVTEWMDGWEQKGWLRKGEPIPNVNLWKALSQLVKQHDIEWHWVRGHTGNPLNERVDQLARQARLAITPTPAAFENAVQLHLKASCKGNPGPGSWLVRLEQNGEVQEFSGVVEENTTNNRMEITAAIEGLLLLPPGTAVLIFTTSDYLFQGVTQWIHGWRKRGWQKKEGEPVANADLWQALDHLLKQYQVRWINAKNRQP